MGSIIEMAARNELLRRDGRHTAHEFLEKLESSLVQRATDGETGPPPPPSPGLQPPIPSPSWSTLIPQARATESSAWIPAARTPPSEKNK
jgi:hypothetical protein